MRQEPAEALAQPLLADIAQTSGVLVGYAFGILLLVPLGDMLNRRTLIPCLAHLAEAFGRLVGLS